MLFSANTANISGISYSGIVLALILVLLAPIAGASSNSLLPSLFSHYLVTIIVTFRIVAMIMFTVKHRMKWPDQFISGPEIDGIGKVCIFLCADI